MIVNQLQTWLRTAPAAGRADGASALARAYLYSDLGAEERRDAERTLTGFLDDPSPVVRRSLAEAFASAKDAPHHIVLALADDQSTVASIVLSRSPILSDAELIDCAAGGDAVAQAAVASRPVLSASVAAALAEIGAPDVLVALAGNRGASLPSFSMCRMIERHGDDAALREALLARSDLPQSVRFELVVATTRALAAFVADRAWMTGDRMKRIAIEERDKAVIAIAGVEANVVQGARHGAADLVGHLRAAGQLTTGLAFRAILSGRVVLFTAILCELSGLSPARVEGLTRHPSSSGFAALYRKAGLPGDLLPAFCIALKAVGETNWHAARPGFNRRVVERVLTGCEAINSGELDKLLVLLRRFEAEAAREDVRAAVASAPLTLSAHERPLLLTDLDAVDYDRPASHGREPVRMAPQAPLQIDLAAIEAELFDLELCAA